GQRVVRMTAAAAIQLPQEKKSAPELFRRRNKANPGAAWPAMWPVGAAKPQAVSLGKPVNPLAVAGGGEHVHLALLVLAEGIDGLRRVLERAVGDDAAERLIVLQRPHPARHIVAVDVPAVEFGDAAAAVDRAAGDRLAHVVVVFPDRVDEVFPRAEAGGAE